MCVGVGAGESFYGGRFILLCSWDSLQHPDPRGWGVLEHSLCVGSSLHEVSAWGRLRAGAS